MTQVNRESASNKAYDTLGMDEYWQAMESMIQTRQGAPGSYNPLIRVPPSETIPGQGNLTFKLSPAQFNGVNDMHNARLRFVVKRKIIVNHQKGNPLVPAATDAETWLFIGQKFGPDMFKSIKISSNSQTIWETNNFVYESNLLGLIYSDLTNKKQKSVFSAPSAIDVMDDNVCGRYVKLNGVPNGSEVTIYYNVIIPMTVYNLFQRLRYLPAFFGTWTIALEPTQDTLVVMKAGNKYQPPYIAPPLALPPPALLEDFQFHPMQTTYNYLEAAGANHQTFEFRPISLEFTEAWFESAQFRLLDDKYSALLYQYSQRPLVIPFSKIVISTGSTSTTLSYADNASDLQPVNYYAKMAATKIDSAFIVFHNPGQVTTSMSRQPIIDDIVISAEGSNGSTYPNGGIRIKTYNDPTVTQWFLDAINMNANSIIAISNETDNNLNPFYQHGEYANGNLGGTVSPIYSLKNVDLSNFMLGIPLSSDGSFMEGIERTGGDINWLVQGMWNKKIKSSTGGGMILNPSIPQSIAVVAVTDYFMRATANPSPIEGQVFSSQSAINI